MRKLVVLGLLLAASTGCGRGWFPHLFRGASCNGLCSSAAPTLHNDCEGCASGHAGYAGYGDEGVVSSGIEMGGYDQGTVGTEQLYTQPPMGSIPSGQIVSPQTPVRP